MAGEVGAEVGQGVARVANELALGHFVLDVGTGEVEGEEEEREAEDVHGVRVERQLRVAGAEAARELLEEERQIGGALRGHSRDLGEEAAKGGGQELVLVVVQLDHILQHRFAEKTLVKSLLLEKIPRYMGCFFWICLSQNGSTNIE